VENLRVFRTRKTALFTGFLGPLYLKYLVFSSNSNPFRKSGILSKLERIRRELVPLKGTQERTLRRECESIAENHLPLTE